MKNLLILIFTISIFLSCTKSEEVVKNEGSAIETRGVEADVESSSILISINRDLTMAYEFFLRGDYSRALRIYKKAIREYTKFDYLHRIPTVYSNIATILQNMNDIQGAERYLKLSDEIGNLYIENVIEKLKLQAVNLNKLALINFSKGNLEKTKEINDKSFEINKKIDNEIGISKNYRVYALFHFSKGNLNEAIKFLDKAIILNIKYLDYYDLILNRITLGEIKTKENKFNLALNYYNLALNISKRKELSLTINIILFKIGELYEKQALLEKALEYYKRSLEVSLNLEADDNIRKQKETEASAKVREIYTKLKKIDELNIYKEIINFFYYTRDGN